MKRLLFCFLILIPFSLAAQIENVEELWQSKQCIDTTIKDIELKRLNEELQLPFDSRIISKLRLDIILLESHFFNPPNNRHFELDSTHFVFIDSASINIDNEDFKLYEFIINRIHAPWSEDNGWLAYYCSKIGFFHFMETHTNIEQIRSFKLQKTTYVNNNFSISNIESMLLRKFIHLECW